LPYYLSSAIAIFLGEIIASPLLTRSYLTINNDELVSKFLPFSRLLTSTSTTNVIGSAVSNFSPEGDGDKAGLELTQLVDCRQIHRTTAVG
jgi:hypothetical protein